MTEQTPLTDIERFARYLEASDDWNVRGVLSARMCCNGDMCGCQGATVGEYLAYQARTLTPSP